MHPHRAALDERKRRILKAVVHEHVETAEPVGSEALALHYDLGVRPATIRNEMAEMADMGYLRQPHTSAGRVPSDMGYRFYVDRLMGSAILLRREASRAGERLAAEATELDRVISQTCRILSGLTRYTSIATQPTAQNTIISHVSLSKVAGRKLLLVVALSDGRVEHRILDLGAEVSDADMVRTSNLLASRFVGEEIDAIGAPATDAALPQAQPLASVCAEVLAVLRQVAESVSLSEAEVWIEGTSYFFKQPEFKDVAKLDAVLAALEERKRLYQLLTRTILGPNVTVVIGSENPYHEMHGTSFVASRYKIGDRVAGTIAVIGPTRMDYRGAVAAVEAMARNLGELLTLLSLS